MKKLLILALVALVAGAAFAETAPAFSGSFEFSSTWDFEAETYTIGATNDAVVELNGVVSDYATVSAELGVGEPDLEDGLDLLVSLNQFNLTNDITGALGVDGPVGVSLKWGLVSHEADEYNGVAGYDDVEPTSESGSYWGSVLTLTIVEKVKVIALIAPSTYTDWAVVGDSGAVLADDDAMFSVEVQFLGLVDGLDANVWYLEDPNESISEAGLTAGYVMGNLSVGAVFKMADINADLGDTIIGAGLSVQYAVADMLTAGVAFGASDFSDFAPNSEIGVNLTYMAVADKLDLYVAAKIPFEAIGDNMGFEGGLKFYLAGVTYGLGYDYNGVGFVSPNGQGMFFSVKADF